MIRRTSLCCLATLGLALALAVAPATASSRPHHPVGHDFLENTIRTGTSLSVPGENIWSCRPPAAHPRPVVLVHGTGGNQASNWRTYAALLANHGYCVFALTYGLSPQLAASPYEVGGMADIRGSARELRDFVAKVLRRTGARRVDLVGHSQGTFMPDYYVRFLGGARNVDHYVSLASLWHGEGAGVFGQLVHSGAAYGFDPAKLVPVCTSCGQMVTGSAIVRRLRSGPHGVAAPGVSYTNIVTRYDDVVLPYTSGIETGHPNMRNIVLQDVCPNDFSDHLEIASSPNAARIVLNTLDPAHAQPVRCRTTLPADGLVTPGT
ncbi:MAG: esterase/lipase family protein [Marmoricola sp.]